MSHPSFRPLAVLLLALVGVTGMQARIRIIPEWFQPVIDWVDRADSTGCDTAYVRLPKEGFIAYVNLLGTGTVGHLTLPQPDGSRARGLLSTPISQALSLNVAYRGWGLSYAFHRGTEWNDDDFSFSFNSRRYGLDYRYHSTRALAPVSGPTLGDAAIGEGLGRMRTTSATAYWVFQRRYFSHPGAMLHTTFQLRSAGSWIAGANYWHGSYRTAPDVLPAHFSRLSLSHLNVGCGYAYNLVFGRRHCLLHTSLIPMLNVWHRDRGYLPSSDAAQHLSQHLSADAVSRVGFVYNQGRYLTGVQYTLDYSCSPCTPGLTLHALDWSQRLFVGVRF